MTTSREAWDQFWRALDDYFRLRNGASRDPVPNEVESVRESVFSIVDAEIEERSKSESARDRFDRVVGEVFRAVDELRAMISTGEAKRNAQARIEGRCAFALPGTGERCLMGADHEGAHRFKVNMTSEPDPEADAVRFVSSEEFESARRAIFAAVCGDCRSGSIPSHNGRSWVHLFRGGWNRECAASGIASAINKALGRPEA